MTSVPTALSPDGGDLFDLSQGKLWVGFVLRSIRRHLVPFLVTASLVGGLGSFLALASPKQYMATSRLIARNDSLINYITVPNQNLNGASEQPAALAEPTIKSEANLEKLVDSLHLVERYEVSETTFGRMKRSLLESIFSAPDPAKKRDELIGLLRQNLTVDATAADKQSIVISLIWTDPATTKEISDAVIKNFLADRRAAEVGLVETAKKISEEQLAKQNKTVDEMRLALGIGETDSNVLPESSPLRAELAIQTEYKQRVIDADTQLKNTESGFSRKYQVITPPELPAAPLSGSIMSILMSLVAGGIVGAGVTTLLDTMRGRIVEPWQASRRFNIPLLAELQS